jgi:hypothetical protein
MGLAHFHTSFGSNAEDGIKYQFPGKLAPDAVFGFSAMTINQRRTRSSEQLYRGRKRSACRIY